MMKKENSKRPRLFNIYRNMVSVLILISAFISNAEEKKEQTLIVDFSDSIIGEYLEKTINCNDSGLNVKRIVKIDELTPSLCENSSSLVIVRLVNPKYYPEHVRNILAETLSKENVGLLLLGLPQKKEDAESLFQFIGKHNIASLDMQYSNVFDKAFWIWSQEPENRNQSVYFRKNFKISEKSQKAFLYVAADNSGSIQLDSSVIGTVYDWAKISIFDVSDKIKKGDNLITAE